MACFNRYLPLLPTKWIDRATWLAIFLLLQKIGSRQKDQALMSFCTFFSTMEMAANQPIDSPTG